MIAPLPPTLNHTSRPQFGQHIIDSYGFLRSLVRTRSVKKRHQLLKRAGTLELLSLVEIALNIVRGRCRISARQKRRMLPFADFIRRMSRARSEAGARRMLLAQKGGSLSPQFFAALLTPIILEISRLFH